MDLPLTNKEKILTIRDLKVHFYTYEGVVEALDGISLDIYKGETLGLVGETGCGKSVAALSILKLIDPPGRIVDGKIIFNDGENTINIIEKTEKEMEHIRGRYIAMIFQDPTTYLNPVYTIGSQIEEAIKKHLNIKSKQRAKEMALEALKLVRMPDPERVYQRYPHELSTGMRQRAMIAMMLSCNPKLLIADEATTALDVTVQAQILNLLNKLKEELHLSILFISHNFGVIASICNRVAVMYAGQIVEVGSTTEVLNDPQHPYTRKLISVVPSLYKKTTILKSIPGSLPRLINPRYKCRFFERCEFKMEICKLAKPKPKDIEKNHLVYCHLFD